SMVPLASKFLWLNLAEGDLIMAILVGSTMWLQQKMSTPTTADPKQQAQTKMMLWMMPLMFGFLCLSFPSGLALFWATSSVIRVLMQYYNTGWGGLASSTAGKQVIRDRRYKRRIAIQEAPLEDSDVGADIGADIVEPGSGQKEGLSWGRPGDKRLDRIRHQPRRSKGYRPKKG
ncbi:YidC/Oxa1 family membrane protein insertase, partial [Chloroflexota bacterium]